MLTVEGYKMFMGEMEVMPRNGAAPFTHIGVWLYRPDTGCWYCNGWSYAEEICKVRWDSGER